MHIATHLARARSAARPGSTTFRGWPLWGGYAAVASALLVAYFSLGNGSDPQLVVYQLFGLGGPVAILVGLRLYRPKGRHWLLFAGALALWVVGDGYWDAYRWILGTQAPYPSAADVAYLGGYPLLIAGVFVLTRGWGRPRLADVLDAGIVVVPAATLTALVLIEPMILAPGASVFGIAVAAAYPVADIVLLVALTRLSSRRAGNFALRCIVAGTATLLFSDAVYSYLVGTGAYTSGMAIDAGWLVSYALWGIAALHPSMVSMRSAPEAAPRLSVGRIAVLFAALLAAPVALIVDTSLGQATEALELGLAAIVTTLLVGARVVILQRERLQVQVKLAESEQRYRELFEDAERARVALAAQNDQLREVDRLKDDLVALVSHELRTPLTSIIGYLELVLDDPDSVAGEPREFLEVVRRNADRLLSLVADLLFVAQAQAGRLVLDRDEVNLGTVVEEAVAAASPQANKALVKLSVDALDDAVVVGDRQRLAQVVDNLLSNALKFTPPGGSIGVEVAGNGDSVTLSVADTGMGIPSAEQQELFTRFFRTEAAMKKAIQGTGLGLSIVKAIVEGHGGDITVESAEGRGSTFRVAMPRAIPLATEQLEAAA